MCAVKLRQAACTSLCALIISSCATPNSTPKPQPAPSPTPVQKSPPASPVEAGGEAESDQSFDNLDIVDSGLNGKITVLRVGSEVGENKLLSVFAGLKNKTARRIVLEIETIYKDKDGNDLNAGSWFTMTLKPHEEKEYHSASISVQAVDFLIRVRRASNATSAAQE